MTAQWPAASFTSVPAPVISTEGECRPVPVFVHSCSGVQDTTTRSERPDWIPPVSSAIIPGSGQLLLGQERGAIYLTMEVFLVTRFLAFSGNGRRESDAYRDLAFEVARQPFDPVLRDTTFEYFEQMQKFVESGPFDAGMGGMVVPPTDERMYNGNIWKLARETFFTNPDSIPDPGSLEYQNALDFYRRRAIGDNFTWSWRNAGLEQDLFRQSIQRSDESFRRASQQLGLLLANHLLSTIDAFVTVRLSKNGRSVSLNSAVWMPKDGRMRGVVQVGVGF